MDYNHTVFKHLENIKIGEFINIFNRLYRRIDENTFQRVLTNQCVKASELHKQNNIQSISLGCSVTLQYSANDTILALYGNNITSTFPVERLRLFLDDLRLKKTSSLLLDSNHGNLWVYFVYTEDPMFDNESVSYKIQLSSNKEVYQEEFIQSTTFKKDLINRIKRFIA